MFLSEEEQLLTKEYLRQGYIIRPVADQKALAWIHKKIYNLSKQNFTDENSSNVDSWLNHIHESITAKQLNDFRLKIIDGIKDESKIVPGP